MNQAAIEKYQTVLSILKEKIREARRRATDTVNTELLKIHWETGKIIAEQEINEGWGSKVIDKLSKDLKSEFNDMKGFSPRNLRYMRDFFTAYPEFPVINYSVGQTILQVPLAKLSWYHHITLLDKVKDSNERAYYICTTAERGWSRNVMVHQIEANLFKRQGNLPSNFATALPPEESELVQQIFKDPYFFEFIYQGDASREKDLEEALTKQITKFLLELGQWFAFLGRQYKVNLRDREFFYDLLFYHTKLKRYVIVELKIGDFQPEHIGKMDFYLKLADDLLRDKNDGNSIGLILCKTKDGVIAEYALRDSKLPIGIAEYKINELLPEHIQRELPEHIQRELPSIEEIEQNLGLEIEAVADPIAQRLEKVKQKLAVRSAGEIEAALDFAGCCKIFDNSFRPLMEKLTATLKEFNPSFVSHNYSWFTGTNTVNDLSTLEQRWKTESAFDTFRGVQYYYQLNGFKFAGTETFDINITLHLVVEKYWYGLKLGGYNNNEVFYKKLCNQYLTEPEIEDISTTIAEQILSDIEKSADARLN
ncbi:DUF1016 domain-containing protein [Pseudoflavitalea sp. G-6-1-2]|uniref:PDDEXK nuclease domain-containing protein n=1 Tax=Pseudoflavitalea sp. G-6-1-2 TaxID=2728841 RepID=UPI00146A0659|nr:PDDEXK nuclease domain-containing protein [Pseudoflavitalea sp. G-6-1-2]NML23338.1 DUF1016 domain-containing protein [Pseudoflavitalea sp. G-6-1-2]